MSGNLNFQAGAPYIEELHDINPLKVRGKLTPPELRLCARLQDMKSPISTSLNAGMSAIGRPAQARACAREQSRRPHQGPEHQRRPHVPFAGKEGGNTIVDSWLPKCMALAMFQRLLKSVFAVVGLPRNRGEAKT